MTFQCERCHRTGRYSTWVTARWRDGNTMQRCDYCGTPHSCAYGRPASAITPPLADIDSPNGVVSPWFDRAYRPYLPGTFECEFDGNINLRLQWNGTAWYHNGLVVDMQTLIKWRGKWQPNVD